MTIHEIKQELNVSELKFQESIDTTSSAVWHKYFNNEVDNRFSISMPDDVLEKLKENRDFNLLSLQYRGEHIAKESGLMYKRYLIVIYSNVTGTF